MRPHCILLLFSLLVFLPALTSGGELARRRPVGDDHDQDLGVLLLHDDELPRVYIVHVRKPPHLVSAGPEVIEQWHTSFLPSLTLPTGEPRMVASYKVVMSGFAAWLTAEQVRAMESSKEGFIHARPDHELVPQTTHSPEFLGLRPDVWGDANRGEGAIIAVIDTGISPDHVSFSGNPMPNPPAEWKGWCYFDDAKTCNDKLLGAAMYHERTQTVVPPYDNNGHGTHVAAIVAGLEVDGASIRGLAAGTAAGAAPGAYLAAYEGGTEWRILWSIEQAINSGAHIISISLGKEPPVGMVPPRFSSSAIAVGGLAAVRRGILVSCAACNYGPRPSSVCNDAPWIMTVGASTMDRALLMKLRLGNGDEILGESLYSRPGLRGRLAYPGLNGDQDADYCTNLDASNVKGRVVMCYPGGITAEQIADVVQRAGGVAVVVLSRETQGSIISNIPNTVFPTVAVNHPNSLKLIEYVSQSSTSPCRVARVQLVPAGTTTGMTPAPAVPSFSSRGPSLANGGIPKPDILGPGVNVLSAKNNSASDFVLMSGTSMATPHLSGIAAIIKLHHRTCGMVWTPAMLRSAIMTTAKTTNNEGNGITDETGKTANLFATGAGQVNPAGAMDPGLVYDIQFEDYVKYLCSLGYSEKEILQTAYISVDCDQFGRIEPEQLNYPSIAVTLSYFIKRKVIRRTVTNVRPEPTSYTVEVSLPAQSGVSVSVSPSTLDLDTMGETKIFEVTFTVATSTEVVPGDTFEGTLRWVSTTQWPVVTSPLLVVIA